MGHDMSESLSESSRRPACCDNDHPLKPLHPESPGDANGDGLGDRGDKGGRGDRGGEGGKGGLLIISGPSGVGKTTITHRVEKEIAALFSVSLTTRPQTAADVNGRDYWFVDRAEFDRQRDVGLLLEWAEVFGHCYGTPIQPVQQAIVSGRWMILEIDVQGAIQVKKRMPESTAVFILPPSEEILLQRLRSRGREGEEAIQRRFAKAKKEIALARESGVYDRFVVNDDLETAIAAVVCCVRPQGR